MPASTALDPDYVLWSAPATQRADRPLIVLLHGWSYDERHLFAFAHLFPQEMVVGSVRAPYAEAGGYAWFPSRGNPIGNPLPRVANDATEAVLDWLNTLPPASSIGLLGFSQGGAMALQLMRRAPARFDYGVQLAGFVVNDAQPGDQVLAHRRPPVFWGRGELDTVIPGRAIVRTRSWMAAHTSQQEVVYPRMGHDVAGREVTDFVTFVARHARTRTSARREAAASIRRLPYPIASRVPSISTGRTAPRYRNTSRPRPKSNPDGNAGSS